MGLLQEEVLMGKVPRLQVPAELLGWEATNREMRTCSKLNLQSDVNDVKVNPSNPKNACPN